MNSYKKAKRIFIVGIILTIFVVFLLFIFQSYPNISIEQRNFYKIESDNYISQPYFTRDGANICKVNDGYCVKRDNDIYWYNDALSSNRLVTSISDTHKNIYGYNGEVYTFKHIDNSVFVVSIDINLGTVNELFEVGTYESEFFDSWKMAIDSDSIYVTDGKSNKRIYIYQYNKTTKDKKEIADFSGKKLYFSDMKVYGKELFYSISDNTNSTYNKMKVARIYKYNPATNNTMQISSYDFKYFTVNQKESLLLAFNESTCSFSETNLDSDKLGFHRNNDLASVDSYVFGDDKYFFTVNNDGSNKNIIIHNILATHSENISSITIPIDEDVVFADELYIFFSSGKVLKKEDILNKTYDDIDLSIY